MRKSHIEILFYDIIYIHSYAVQKHGKLYSNQALNLVLAINCEIILRI